MEAMWVGHSEHPGKIERLANNADLVLKTLTQVSEGQLGRVNWERKSLVEGRAAARDVALGSRYDVCCK